eukprot:CAMPEP_0178917308 /NCGR_PEP_ID=MMETSP0786-20121207/13173_1 /TAXON_ID=186022 /ORGANISM="Thalassionema frauenfeldii, Strain CCMP 1798" /LENGTH=416 /DNA_ID=CAMNT_0020590841 /DNA_START=84 /DNA_END=1334 /DNA_ORIENTATION=-
MGKSLYCFHGETCGSPTSVCSLPELACRKGVSLPILDLSDSDTKLVTPLPSSHLPDELTTLNLYGLELSRPIHKMLMSDMIEKGRTPSEDNLERVFGYIIKKKDTDSLVGAIGCSAEVLIRAKERDVEDNSEIGMDASIVVLCRGCYRFVVREVVKTIPYPVAIVDEFLDKESLENTTIPEDDDLYEFSQVSNRELKKRIMTGVASFIDLKLEDLSRPVERSILEQSILDQMGLPKTDIAAKRSQIEESAAVFQTFSSSLIDIASTPLEQNFAIAMLAAEIISLDDDLRQEIITMTDSALRLKVVCKAVEETVSLIRAEKLATEITTEKDTSAKDLNVGQPQLPPWAVQISKGTRVEYFWNEEWGWSPAEVIEDPIQIMDELIITVRFDADGEVHRLPLNPDEKLRWRPDGFDQKD